MKKGEYSQAIYNAYRKWLGKPLIPEAESSIRKNDLLQVLGPGYPACDKLEHDLKSILAELNQVTTVEHVRDLNQIVNFGFVPPPDW